MHSLRTRLFLMVAIVLAAAIAASSLLSRRATLVEVNRVVGGPVAVNGGALRGAAPRVEEHIRTRGLRPSAELDALLAEAGRSLRGAFILVDAGKRIVGGSSRQLAGATVREATPEGRVALDLTAGDDRARLEVRGAPVHVVRDAAGVASAYLYQLPAPDDEEAFRAFTRLPPPWILATAAVGIIALILTFELSRRILRPVGALTAAAERMKQGDLDARVGAYGRDEIAGLSRAFNAMAERIARTEQVRRQMVSDVAHELRSPVTNLRCTLEAIQDGLMQPDRASIDALHDETLFLQRLIGDLQELALADAGRLDMHMAEVDLEAVVTRAAGTLATEDGAPIRIHVGAGRPSVHGDADRLEQVFRNLLVNARTHTPADGAIAIEIEPAAQGVVVHVRDTGLGIAAEDLPHIFDRFYRADRSRARATGGAGLGLAIARQLVAAHGGTLSASSGGVRTGATFTVSLPAASGTAPAAASASKGHA